MLNCYILPSAQASLVTQTFMVQKPIQVAGRETRYNEGRWRIIVATVVDEEPSMQSTVL